MKHPITEENEIAGNNHFKMLTFTLGGTIYGINVFKVREILKTPRIVPLPRQSPLVKGIVSVRGEIMPLINLARSVGVNENDGLDSMTIVTEFNNQVQALLVSSVERICDVNWSDVSPPPKNSQTNQVTSVVTAGDNIVNVLDLESIVEPIQNLKTEASQIATESLLGTKPILVADDSRTAQRVICNCIEKMGGKALVFENGQDVWDHLSKPNVSVDDYALLISDIEMPKLDGYTLTSKIKSSTLMKQLTVILHSSLSGSFNDSISKSVGADMSLSKFNADNLQEVLIKYTNNN
jgi:two-component system chemotaxis response regulator CheV